MDSVLIQVSNKFCVHQRILYYTCIANSYSMVMLWEARNTRYYTCTAHRCSMVMLWEARRGNWEVRAATGTWDGRKVRYPAPAPGKHKLQ